MTRPALLAALPALLLIAAIPAAPAFASGAQRAETGISALPQRPAAPVISEDVARTIAFEHGMVHVEEIALIDGRWELGGRDRAGMELVLDLCGLDGAVIP